LRSLSEFHPPRFRKRREAFLDMLDITGRFIENFTNIAAPMFGLLIKDVDFVWTEQCKTNFKTLKATIYVAPVLRGPNWTLPFHISIDASDTTR
jgi:hypothetical protein